MSAKPKQSLQEWLERKKKARRFIAENPGATSEEIYKADATHIGTLAILKAQKLIRCERPGNKGPAKWFVIPQ